MLTIFVLIHMADYCNCTMLIGPSVAWKINLFLTVDQAV